jgi:uncharacterized RDD family membrane protein YckC
VSTEPDPLGEAARDWHGYYAGFGSRFVAYVIDAILLVVGFYMSMGFASLLVALASLERPRMFDLTDLEWLLFFLGFSWTYFTFLWWIYGRTAGMALLGLRMVSKKGNRAGFVRSLIRPPAYLVSYLVFCLGFLWILVSPARRGWHDYVANTCVVYDWDARPGAHFRAAREKARAHDTMGAA